MALLSDPNPILTSPSTMAMADSFSHVRLIDHSNDPDIMSMAYYTDAQLILKGWSDAKVAVGS